MTKPRSATREFEWEPHPAAARLIRKLVETSCRRSAFAKSLADRMSTETGTRLLDWVDHIALPEPPGTIERLHEMGFTQVTQDGATVLSHLGGMFPPIVVDQAVPPRLAIKVESVVDFLSAHEFDDSKRTIDGGPRSRLRTVVIDDNSDGELWAVERHGYCGFEKLDLTPEQLQASLDFSEAFQLRCRAFERAAEGFANAAKRIREANQVLNIDMVCDLFFAAERRFWQQRNHAARVQKARQDRLGLGWANHDHHTYRSSREQFTNLIGVLELLGFRCRERFYGGRDAGWGAQVLTQPNCGIVIFADVDLSPDEVTGDFAHNGLATRDCLGTVGLWCRLHGEAFLQAGLHHLECQFDFALARQQLAAEGVPTMTPFTDFPYLKQAFTQGEMWQVEDGRLASAVRDGLISPEQAQQFRDNGCIGSHLEVLERNDGYQGFNQTGINAIIRETDPRHQDSGQYP